MRQVIINESILPCLQCKPNTRSNTLRTSDMYRLSMRFDDMFADGETEAAAGDVDAATLFGTVETLEYTGEVFFADADTIITDLD